MRTVEITSQAGAGAARNGRGCREHRCHCGQLLAKISAAGVELKCKRCKRIELVPWSTGSAGQGD